MSYRKKACFLLLPIFGLLVFPPAVFPNGGTVGADIYRMGEVVVTGERDGVESIGAVRVITAREIKERGARNLAEALALMPGMHLRVGAQGTPRVDMRGMRTRHVILLLDGIPYNSTLDGQFDPSTISVENIAKIKVSYSNHSVLYGEGGIGGVINIVTRKGEEGLRGTIGGEIGERNSYQGTFSVSGAQDKVDFFVSGRAYDTDGLGLSGDFDPTPEQGKGLRLNSDRENYTLFANLGVAPKDNFMAGFIFHTVHGRLGAPPTTIDGGDFAQRIRYDRTEDLEGYSGQVSLQYNPSRALEIRSWAYMNQLTEENNRYNDNRYQLISNNNTYSDHTTSKVQGVNVQAGYTTDQSGSLSVAFSFRRDTWDQHYMWRRDHPTQRRDDFFKYTNDVSMAALEYSVEPLDGLGLVLGYSYNWLSKDRGSSDGAGSWLAGLYYDLTESTRLRGSYARKIRFPSIRQLYEANSGNTELQTEKSNNYEVGIIQRLPYRTTVELTGFYMDVKDYIERVDVAPGVTLNLNHEQYRFSGIEVVAENRFVDNLAVRAGFTLMDTKDKSTGSPRSDLQYRPKRKLTVESTYYFDFGLTAQANLLHVSGQHNYSRTAPLQKATFNDYTLVGVKLNQALLKDRLDIYIGANNLLDEDYEESFAFPQPGRYLYGGFELRF